VCYLFIYCLGVAISGHECHNAVASKQTEHCHDNDIDASVGLMQQVVRVSCSDVTSPETDTEGILVASVCERLDHVRL